MASIVRVPIVPQCVQCMRHSFLGDIPSLRAPVYQQVRGKKRTPKRSSTIKVKLRADIPGYGRNGSIIPVAPGRMRNIWYPRQMAEYMTQTQLKEIPDLVAERDFAFGMEKEEDSKVKKEMVDVQMKLLSPARATELIKALIPPELVFYKTPISTPEQADTKPAIASNKGIETPDFSAKMQPSVKGNIRIESIYGSVSSSDIAESARALLSADEDGKRVVLGTDEVSIIRERATEEGMEPGKIKALGSFAVDFRVKGGEPIRRTVVVKAQSGEQV